MTVPQNRFHVSWGKMDRLMPFTVSAVTLLSLSICAFQPVAQESMPVADNEIEEIVTIGTRSRDRAAGAPYNTVTPHTE